MVKTPEAPTRCGWCGDDALYQTYHDEEWGVPVFDSHALFERLMLEGMQAGLSWLTILKKRAHMTTALMGFDPQRLARATDADVARWMTDTGLIRNRAKLQSMISNARACLSLQETDPAGFGGFLWSFSDGAPLQNRWRTLAEVPGQTPVSLAMSKELKKAGFNFVGPTICYAFMQSAGMVNDHVTDCFRYTELSS